MYLSEAVIILDGYFIAGMSDEAIAWEVVRAQLKSVGLPATAPMPVSTPKPCPGADCKEWAGGFVGICRACIRYPHQHDYFNPHLDTASA